MTIARVVGPERVQCVRCGKLVAPIKDGRPKMHNCRHGWACPPRARGQRACPLCGEARQLDLWQRHDGKPHGAR